MKIRTIALAGALCVALLVTGCATSIAGQAEVAAGTVAPTSAGDDESSSSATTDPTDSDATTEQDSTQDSSAPETTAATTEQDSTSSGDSGDSSTSEPSTTPSDKSVAPTSIPGLSADCNKVLAAITVFSSVLQGASSGAVDAKITQATVDEALKQLPSSGLPARPQADINVLRDTISGAAGKTVAELGMTMTDGKVVAALQDLSTWATTTCA